MSNSILAVSQKIRFTIKKIIQRT